MGLKLGQPLALYLLTGPSITAPASHVPRYARAISACVLTQLLSPTAQLGSQAHLPRGCLVWPHATSCFRLPTFPPDLPTFNLSIFICMLKFQRRKWVRSTTLSGPLTSPFSIDPRTVFFLSFPFPFPYLQLLPLFCAFASIGDFPAVMTHLPFLFSSKLSNIPLFLSSTMHRYAHCNLASITHLLNQLRILLHWLAKSNGHPSVLKILNLLLNNFLPEILYFLGFYDTMGFQVSSLLSNQLFYIFFSHFLLLLALQMWIFPRVSSSPFSSYL